MRRPFGNKRPIGPFSDTIKKNLSLIGPGSEPDKIQSARAEINEAYSQTPSYAKDSESCVEWMKSNVLNELEELVERTKSSNDEHTFAVCYNGTDSVVSQIEQGGHDVTPSVSCGGDSWKLIDVHTHPMGSPIYPSSTDLGTIILDEKVFIPTTLNEVILRADGVGSCLNTFDVAARQSIIETEDAMDPDEFSRREMAEMSMELVEEYGSEFRI